MAVNIAVFGAFVLIVAVFAFFHWQTLFASEKYGYSEEKAEPTYSQQAARSENASGTSASPSGSKKTDEAIAEYTKWLAIFTMFLVLATIGLFICGERNVDVARRAADAAKKSADAATDNIKSLRAQLRAYLEIRGQRPTRDRNQFVIVLKNVGQTPAKNVRGHLNQQWYTDKRDLDAGFTFPDLDVPAVPYGSLMTFVRDQEQEMFLWP